MWPFRKSPLAKPAPLTLDEALAELAGMGVTLLSEGAREEIPASLGSGKNGPVDRVELLCVIGSEAESGDCGWFSNDIWHIDAECIVEDGDYVRLAQRFIALAKGWLPLTALRDHVDIESKEAWFEFQLEGRMTRWNLTIEDDWLDPEFYTRFQQLLSSRSKLRFMICALGQDSLILCGDDRLRTAISTFSGQAFQWE